MVDPGVIRNIDTRQTFPQEQRKKKKQSSRRKHKEKEEDAPTTEDQSESASTDSTEKGLGGQIDLTV